MRQKGWVVLIFILFSVGAVLAQEDPGETPPSQTAPSQSQTPSPQTPSGGLTVENASVALKVESREPVGAANFFPADVGQLSCFSKIKGAKGETFIYHVWKHGDTERAKVRLAVKSSAWRTWSTKKIDPSWTGAWTVEVLDSEDNTLETLSFTVQ